MKIITHSGSFHADEVFGTASLKRVFLDAEIVRSRDPEVVASGGIVLDVGQEYDGETRFDHHQGGIEPRGNGVPYASFGLVWKRFGRDIAGSEEAARMIDERLVQPIDSEDNSVRTYANAIPGVYPYTVHDVMHSMYPDWDDPEYGYDRGFQQALEFASGTLEREIRQAAALLRSKGRFDAAYRAAPDKRLVVLDGRFPFEEYMRDYPEVLFVVFPSSTEGQWHAKAARDDFHFYDNRSEFPLSWAGKRDTDLAAASGVPDAVFCHKGRFLAVARSREGAIRLAQLAVNS